MNFATKKKYYIDRPLIWKILNLWYIPAGLFIPLLFPFTLLYTGIVGQKKTWTNISIVLIAIFLISTFLVLANIMRNLFAGLIVAAFVFQIIYVILSAKEFLQRLDIILREGTLFKGIKSSIENDPAFSKDSLGKQFIQELHQWHREIQSLKMKNNILRLIEIAVIILKRDNDDSKRFFIRYHETINTLLKKYDEMENTRLDTDEISQAMQNIEDSMESIATAFQNEAAAMYKNDLLDINAETAAFLQDLKNRGLLENKNNHVNS